jgi:hypothetical protein
MGALCMKRSKMFDLWHERDMKLLEDSLQNNSELQKQNKALIHSKEDLEEKIAEMSVELEKVSQSSCCTIQQIYNRIQTGIGTF